MSKTVHENQILSIRVLIEENFTLLLLKELKDSTYIKLNRESANQLDELIPSLESAHLSVVRTLNGNLQVLSLPQDSFDLNKTLSILEKMNVKNIAYSKLNLANASRFEEKEFLKKCTQTSTIEKVWSSL